MLRSSDFLYSVLDMKTEKIRCIAETLRKLGFILTLDEFYNISVGNVLGRYGIKEKLSKEDSGFW